MFEDREDAGRKLAKALLRYRNSDVVVLGLPRGGVPIAFEIAKTLDAQMGLVFVRKIGLPGAPELAMGAVVDGPQPHVFKNGEVIRRFRVPEEEFSKVMEAELDEIERRKSVLGSALPRIDVKGKTVILADDGIATGSTMKAAAMAIEQAGVDRIVVAVPAAPLSSVRDLEGEVEEVVCLEPVASFRSVGDVYRRFPQLSDQDVIDYFRQRLGPDRRTG